MSTFIFLLLFDLLSITAFQDSCNWCGAFEAPDNITNKATIHPNNEPGELMVISGRVYDYNGKTPAQNVIIYVYHTNSEGVYPKNGNETGNGKYHGYLRGWMITDASGYYEFKSIRPAPYQTHGGEPGHIHYTLLAPGKEEYWINAAWFSDDPRVTEKLLNGLKRKGGQTNVIDIKKDSEGVWRGTRDIILKEY